MPEERATVVVESPRGGGCAYSIFSSISRLPIHTLLHKSLRFVQKCPPKSSFYLFLKISWPDTTRESVLGLQVMSLHLFASVNNIFHRKATNTECVGTAATAASKFALVFVAKTVVRLILFICVLIRALDCTTLSNFTYGSHFPLRNILLFLVILCISLHNYPYTLV